MYYKRKKIQVISTVFGITILVSCSSALYIPTADKTPAGISVEDLHEGRKLYINNCGSCHLLYHPKSYSKDKWKHEVDEMQERTKIDDRTKELILKYLWNAPG